MLTSDLLHTQLADTPTGIAVSSPLTSRQPVALGEISGSAAPQSGDRSGGNDGSGGGLSDEDALQARLDALRRG
jgi:charged multivesicular body protein 2A